MKDVLAALEVTVEKWEQMRAYAEKDDLEMMQEKYESDCHLCVYFEQDCSQCPIYDLLGYRCYRHKAYDTIGYKLSRNITTEIIDDIYKCIEVLIDVHEIEKRKPK